MKIARIILGFFACIAVLFELYLGVFSLVGFFIQVIFMALIVSTFIYFLSSRKKEYKKVFLSFVLIFTGIIGVCISFIAIFVTYHNTYPGTLADVTLTDGSGSVVFLQMSHIAHPDFFEEKNIRLQSLAQSGYTILFEGVRSGSPESHDKFDNYMGFRFTKTLYDTLGQLTGLEAQDNSRLYNGIATGSLVSVDVSVDDIVSLMEQDTPEIQYNTVSGEIPNIEGDIVLAMKNMSHRDALLIRYNIRAFLNWTLKNSHSFEEALLSGNKAGLFRTIIQKRDDRVIEYIRTHPGEKIAVVYGAMHFNGIYEGLQKLSPKWKIVEMKTTYPYR